jgi:hypothetical protein
MRIIPYVPKEDRFQLEEGSISKLTSIIIGFGLITLAAVYYFLM